MKRLLFAFSMCIGFLGSASGIEDAIPDGTLSSVQTCLSTSSSTSTASISSSTTSDVSSHSSSSGQSTADLGCQPIEPCSSEYWYQPEAVVPTSSCARFLQKYINKEQQALPADRIYPNGQKMMMAAWLAKSESDLKRLATAGFTMMGPNWDTRDISYLKRANEQGLKAAHKINDTAGTSIKLQERLATPEGEAGIWREVEKRIKAVVDDPVYNDTVEVWLQGSEELSTRRFDGDLAYIQKFRDMIQLHDPQQRPLWMSDVTGVSANQMIDTHWWLDMVGPQMYLERIGKPGFYQHNAVINQLVCNVVKAATLLDAAYPLPRKRPATVSFGALYEPVTERDTEAFIDKIVEHDLYLALNNGLQGFQVYSWNNYTWDGASDVTTWNWYKEAWYKHVKRFTDYDLDNVYLWGARRYDLNLDVVQGPERIQWQHGAILHDYPSVSMQNIQYGSKRYLILTNSNTEVVQVEVSGFPQNCVRTLDMHSGIYMANAETLKATLQPYDVKLYRFEATKDN